MRTLEWERKLGAGVRHIYICVAYWNMIFGRNSGGRGGRKSREFPIANAPCRKKWYVLPLNMLHGEVVVNRFLHYDMICDMPLDLRKGFAHDPNPKMLLEPPK